MGNMIRSIALALVLISTGCINMTTVQNSKKNDSNVTKKIKSDGKIVQLHLKYSNNSYANLDINKSNYQNSSLEIELAATIDKKYKFKSLHLMPTMYQKITNPEKYNDDLDLKVVINETTVSDESFSETVLRGISFGFYPQKILKHLEYKLEITDVRTNKKFNSESVVSANYSYQAPMLVIPINLDNHPFTLSQQSAKHREAVMELMNQVIE